MKIFTLASKFYFFIVIIILIIPASELFLVKGVLDDGDLELYLMGLSFILLFGYVTFSSNLLSCNSIVMCNDEVVKEKYLLLVSFASFFIFMIFISSNVDNWLQLAIFSEKYRNGFYKGSGIFTFPILTIVPAILSLLIIKQKKLNKSFFISLSLVIVSSFIVGLRIFLYAIIFLGIVRMLKTYSIKKMAFYLMILFLFMFSYKFFLNPTDIGSKDSISKVMTILARNNYRTLLEFDNFSVDLGSFRGILLPIAKITNSSIGEFKELFLQGNNLNKISEGLPNLRLYTGVALPFGIILYNTFSVIGLALFLPYLFVLFYVFSKMCKSDNLFKASIYVSIFVGLLGVLTEDINFINRIFSLIVANFIIYIFYNNDISNRCIVV